MHSIEFIFNRDFIKLICSFISLFGFIGKEYKKLADKKYMRKIIETYIIILLFILLY